MEELVATLTFDQLLGELGRRFPTMIFAGHQTVLGDEERWTTRTRSAGPLPHCLGLAELMKNRCNKLLDDESEDDEEDT